MSEEEEEAHEAKYENETRPEKMVSLQDGKITVRMATFLKPTAKDVEEAAEIPRNTPLLSEILRREGNWPSTVIFKGWKDPQRKWMEWVDRLAPKYAPTWIKAGIFDSIISSTFKLWRNEELLLGLSEYWCPETNTFVFQWGEATITLEDVMILGGYSVHGEPVISPSPQTQEMTEIEANLRKYRTQFGRTPAHKVNQGAWIKFFMEKETDCEHAAFLSLWLSRFVFPSVSGTVTTDVLAIAVKLSLGIRVALTPAVLASLYKDLRKLSQEAMASSQKIVLFAPFQLLQVWAFERFPILRPKCPNLIRPGEPRIARWNKVNLKLSMPIVRSSFESVKNFEWRPYVANVKNWEHPSYYKETDQLVSEYSSVSEDDGLLLFLKIVQASELVGLNCRERYSPHRVAMQFGMDQDIPGELDTLQMNKEVVDFYIPPKTFQPGITERYSNWWKDMLVVRKSAMKQLLLNKKYTLIGLHQNNGGTEDCIVRTKITRRKHKALDMSDNVESCTPKPDVATQLKNSTKASTESIFEDSNQPITLSSSEDSDDDHLPISTCLRKSSHHETLAVASQTSDIRERKLSPSHNEENLNSHKKELSFGKETDQVLEPLTKPLDMNTDNESARRNREGEMSSIKGNEERIIEIPESKIESRVSRLERIVEGLKALKAAKALR